VFISPTHLEQAAPADVLHWLGDNAARADIVVTASFEDAVLVHLAATTLPGVEVVLLDTGYLFAETQWLARRLTEQFDINLRIIRPAADVADDDLWQRDTARCCDLRKVEPLDRALAGKAAWVTGVRRADGPTRANAPIAAYDIGRRLLKVNPLATFSDDDMVLYAHLHDLPANPLTERGYPSIGCWPCTRPVPPGADKRSGRWSGEAKTECGLHV
jgi:phosphoadenosine phosphosulfate reductase